MSLPRALIALATDILSAVGVPGGATLQEATARVLGRRLANARAILLEEIRLGKKHTAQAGIEDEFAAFLFRYQRAATEGTARLNLRLLAAVAAGQIERGGFAADDFLAWADTLASLQGEELILLATLRRIEETPPHPGNGKSAVADPVWTALSTALISDPFCSSEDMAGAASACMRTGLLMVTSGSLDQPVMFKTTPRLVELLALASIEDVLGREPRCR